jgi:alanyl-tRNA synthetase
MATRRLYHEDPSRLRFDATIVSKAEDERGVWIELDATAFYPTSGGQPHDTGTLGPARVLDVEDRDDRIFHLVAGWVEASNVEGRVDGDRRFDHMQQHTAQHMLTRVLLDDYGVRTIGFHIGDRVSNVDLDRSDLPSDTWAKLEERLAALIREDRPVTVSSVLAEEAPDLGLRKIPDGRDVLRVLTIEGLDRTACGGTHVSSTREVERITLLGTENVGSRCRLYYLAGGRSRRDQRAKHEILTRLAGRFSTSIDDLEAALDRSLGELQETRRTLKGKQRELAWHHLSSWRSALATPAIITRRLSEADLEATVYADVLARFEATCLLLGWVQGERAHLLFARTPDLDSLGLPPVLAAALTHVEGKGGGGPSRAQGSGSRPAGLDDALRHAAASVKSLLRGPHLA